MVTEALRLTAEARPVGWAALLPYDGEQGTLWQVWMRERGAGYWLLRWATRLANLLRRSAPLSNPNGLEDGGTYRTLEEAEDFCRIVHRDTGGRKAVTISPVVVGRAFPVRPERARGDRPFDPFTVFDFSATEAVKEQARHVLITVEEWEEAKEAKAILSGALRTEPRT